MKFVESSIADIKSISQRTLALHWSRAAAGKPVPHFQSFEIPSRGHDPNYMAIWRVQRSVTGPVFSAIFQGAYIATAFRQRWEGRKMEELIPKSLRAPALDAARFCAEKQVGVYMIYTTLDSDGRRIDCERLLLPFATPDSRVGVLLATMEAISLKGYVVLSKALDHFERSYDIAFAGCFSPQPRSVAFQANH